MPTQKIEIEKEEKTSREKCADTEKKKRKRGRRPQRNSVLTQKTERKKEEAPKQVQKRNFIRELQDSDQLRGVVDVGH